jgi:hypothetical protein
MGGFALIAVIGSVNKTTPLVEKLKFVSNPEFNKIFRG